MPPPKKKTSFRRERKIPVYHDMIVEKQHWQGKPQFAFPSENLYEEYAHVLLFANASGHTNMSYMVPNLLPL